MLISGRGARFGKEGFAKVVSVSSTTSIDLPRSNRIVVESLKAAIRVGDRILEKIGAYSTYGDGSSTEDFYCKLNTLWMLCVMIGAGICEPHNLFSEELAATWMKDPENMHKLFLGIERRVNSHIAEDSGPSRTQFARLMDQLLETYRQDLDEAIEDMTEWTFELNSKPLSGEDGLKS